MPELPEIETIKRVLYNHIVGKKIKSVIVKNQSVLANCSSEYFAQKITNQTISNFDRRGKFLYIYLESGDTIPLHLRMTGSLIVCPKDMEMGKHTHLILTLDDNNEIRYEDTRRFGRFWIIENGKDDESGINKLGKEPFDVSFTYLKDRIYKSKKTIKELLLDQTIIAGIGNIYSDEILFSCGILPTKLGKELTNKEIKILSNIIPQTINYFIDKNNISFEEYVSTKGKDYRNIPYLKVYGRAGKPCLLCKNILLHTKIGGRSSVFCPHCQK